MCTRALPGPTREGRTACARTGNVRTRRAPGCGSHVSRAVQRTPGSVSPTHKESRVRGRRSGAPVQGIPHIASTPHDGRLSSVPPARGEQYPARQTGWDMTQRLPHQGAAPRVAPAARRPEAVLPRHPVFIARSSWRTRTLQCVALAVGCACLGYLLFVGMVISGLRQPVGAHPPSVNGPVPSGPDTGKSQYGRGAHARAEAYRLPARAQADRDDRRQPPAGRSAPPAGGPKQ